MTNTERVLELLELHGELNGAGLVRLSKGSVSRDAVYIVLQRLEERGVVVSRVGRAQDMPGGGVGRPFRYYSLSTTRSACEPAPASRRYT